MIYIKLHINLKTLFKFSRSETTSLTFRAQNSRCDGNRAEVVKRNRKCTTTPSDWKYKCSLQADLFRHHIRFCGVVESTSFAMKQVCSHIIGKTACSTIGKSSCPFIEMHDWSDFLEALKVIRLNLEAKAKNQRELFIA